MLHVDVPNATDPHSVLPQKDMDNGDDSTWESKDVPKTTRPGKFLSEIINPQKFFPLTVRTYGPKKRRHRNGASAGALGALHGSASGLAVEEGETKSSEYVGFW